MLKVMFTITCCASSGKESKSGKKYMSLKFSEFQPKGDTGHTFTTTTTETADIPF